MQVSTLYLLGPTFLLWLTACAGSRNIASCPSGGEHGLCSPETPDEVALATLNSGDYTGAIDQLNTLVAAEPTNYGRFPLLSSAYAARSGLAIVNVFKAQFGAQSSVLSIFNAFVPTPKTVGAAAYPAHVDDMKAAVTSLHRIPAALVASETASPYAASAILQLTLYQVAYAVMYLNQFAVSPVSGSIDPAQLQTLTPDQAAQILDNFTAASNVPGLGTNAAVQARVTATVAAINAEPGATTKDKLTAYLAANPGAVPSGSSSGP